MSKTPQELRALAADCATRARQSGPRRAQQLRAATAAFTRQALRAELFHHSKTVGRANVTLSSFREHLRAHLRETTSG